MPRPAQDSHLAGPAQTSLNLVADEQHVVLFADFMAFCEIAVVGYVDAARVRHCLLCHCVHPPDHNPVHTPSCLPLLSTRAASSACEAAPLLNTHISRSPAYLQKAPPHLHLFHHMRQRGKLTPLHLE